MADGKIVIKTSIDTAEALKSIQALSGAVSKVFDGADSPDFTNTAQSAEKAVKAVDKVETELEQVTEEAKNAGSAGKQAGIDMEQSFDKASNQAQHLMTLMKSVMMGYTGKKLVDYFIGSNTDMEQYITSFETMLGSAEKAKDLMSDLQGMANVTPFETTQLTSASQTLLAFGENIENLQGDLSMLGDISQGNAEKLSSLSLAFGQIQSTGHLMGQDLLQLINVGFNPLQVISEKTGESMDSLKQKMSDGKISFDMVREAMKSATSEGGLFYQAMEKQSKTVSGMLSTLKDEFVQFGRDSGQEAFGQLSEYLGELLEQLEKAKADGSLAAIAEDVGNFVATVTKAIINLGKFIVWARQGVVSFTVAMVAFKAAMAIGNLISGVVTSIKAFKSATDSATASQAVFNATAAANPYVLIASVLIGVTAGIAAFAAQADNAAEKIAKINTETQSLMSKSDNFSSLIKEYEELANKVDKTAEEHTKFNDLQAQILEAADGRIKAVDLENMSLSEQLELLKGINEENRKATYESAKSAYDEAKKTFDTSGFNNLAASYAPLVANEMGIFSTEEAKEYINVMNDINATIDERYSATEKLHELMLRSGESDTEAAKNTAQILEGLSEQYKELTKAENNVYLSSPEYIKSQEEKQKANEKLEKQLEQQSYSEKRRAELLKTSAESARTSMKTMGTAVSEVASALSEADEDGNISYNTALKLIDSGYAAAISFDSETGAIKLNAQALKDLTNQKIDAEIAIQNEAEAELELAKARAESTKAALLERRYSISNQYDAEKLATAQREFAEAEAALAEVKTSIAALEGMKTNFANNNYTPYTSGSGGGKTKEEVVKTAEEIAEAAYNAEIKAQKYRYDIGIISEKKYYDKLAAARKKYLKEGTDLWKSSYKETFEYMKKTADAETSTILSSLEALQSARDGAMQKMVDNAALYSKESVTIPETVKTSGKWTVTTAEHTKDGMDVSNSRLREALAQNKKYEELRKKLIAKGANEYIIETFDGLSVDDAILYAEAVLAKSSTDFADYNTLSGQVKSDSQKRADRMYKSQLDELRTGFIDKVNAVFKGLNGDMALHGQEMVNSLLDGWNSQLKAKGMSGKVSFSDILNFGTLSTAPASAKQEAAKTVAKTTNTVVQKTETIIKTTTPINFILGTSKLGSIVIEAINGEIKKIGKNPLNT